MLMYYVLSIAYTVMDGLYSQYHYLCIACIDSTYHHVYSIHIHSMMVLDEYTYYIAAMH